MHLDCHDSCVGRSTLCSSAEATRWLITRTIKIRRKNNHSAKIELPGKEEMNVIYFDSMFDWTSSVDI